VERRFVVFLVSVTLIWGSWIALQAYLESKRPKVAKPPEKPVAKAEAEPEVNEKKAEEPDAEPKPPVEAAVAEAKPPPRGEEPATPKTPRQWRALGSADPAVVTAAFFISITAAQPSNASS